ncbi:hypothetical protein OPV22_009783 [Ensete ventricosum]|uniref:Protein NUCLEAR FUSION DEFECTIVE 6, chloroplastic/mitochondrial-like n=1 Tax=Ensete ventricosum TaxID=4639 RepID=A0AAV8R9N5_ENSVE|nr:hypothetical protein OPV22_009783 [Ensete ventricosum]
MIVAAARRSLMRSSSLRNPAAARIGASRASLRSPPKLRPAATPSRILRSPVETIFCVESLLPMHSTTASALMTSMLAVSRRGYGWLSEAGNDDISEDTALITEPQISC